MSEYVNVRHTDILLRVTKLKVFVPFSLFLDIRLQVVQIPLTILFARAILFIFLLFALDIFTVIYPLYLYQ